MIVLTMLESTIDDLEKVKMEILHQAFDKINIDFGNIFKTLLPGEFAKLEPVSKITLLEGFEFKVAFGDVWKESFHWLHCHLFCHCFCISRHRCIFLTRFLLLWRLLIHRILDWWSRSTFEIFRLVSDCVIERWYV